MGGLIDAWMEVVKNTYNLKLWLFHLCLLIVTIAITWIIGLIFSFGIFALIFGTVTTAIENQNFLPLIFIGLILGIIYFLIIFLIQTFVEGISLNWCFGLLKNKKFFLEEGIHKTIPRIVPAYLQEILVVVVIIVILAIVFAPIIPMFLNLVQTVTPITRGATGQAQAITFLPFFLQQFTGIIIYLVIVAIILLVLFLIFLPFFVLYRQIVFFENIGVIDSIKKSLRLSFKNYFRNWGFILITFIPLVVIVLIIASIFGLLAVLFAKAPGTGTADLGVLLFGILLFVFYVIVIPLLMNYGNLFKTKLYFLNLGKEAGVIEKKPEKVSPTLVRAKRSPEEQPWVKKRVTGV